MKIISIAVLLLFLAVGLIALKQFRQEPATATDSGNLVLTNLPSQYCPTRARLLLSQAAASGAIIDREVNVDNCRYVSLSKYLSGRQDNYIIHLKLARALAFTFELKAPLEGVVEYPVQLGDVNNDNVIDAMDDKAVSQLLFSETSPELDLNGDKIVTIDDLSIVRLNQGVGAARPDGAAWAKVSND